MRVDILLREEVVCPSGTTWFACSMGDFRGCCSEDPCEAGRCKRGHVDLTILPTESEAATSESRSMTTSIKGHGGSQSDDNLLPSESSEGDTMSTITTKDAQSTTMTDSGITHTIPNSNRVTVTKHTVIVTDKAPTPISTSVIVSSSGTQWSAIPSLSGSAPAETTPAGDSVEIATNSSPSTGMIAGVAIGGAIALGICTFLLIRFLRRTRGVAVGMGPDERFSIEDHPDNDHGEKSFLQAMSPHNTGSQGSQGTTYTSNMQGSQRRGDPFAPFGGRVDRLDDPLRPQSGTFEMDGTSAAPAELSAENHNHSRSSTKPHSKGETSQPYPTQPAGPVDPQATLNASVLDRRQNTYVNHWNQYSQPRI